jgi:hypothetical protein
MPYNNYVIIIKNIFTISNIYISIIYFKNNIHQYQATPLEYFQIITITNNNIPATKIFIQRSATGLS